MGATTSMRNDSRLARRGFTIVELLVVIGIIALLIGLLMPALTRARQQANSVKCQANLRTLGQMLFLYENNYRGWIFPVGPATVFSTRPTTLGTNVPPHERWPMKVFKFAYPWPPPYDPAAYNPNINPTDKANQIAQMNAFPAEPYTPPVLRCPTDLDPWDAHSYVLNQHLADNFIKASSKNFGGLTATEVIIAGEKVTTERDYHMEAGADPDNPNSDFNRVVEKYRHGPKLGSNYLYFDGHVGTVLPDAAKTGMDPWDLRKPATQPSGG